MTADYSPEFTPSTKSPRRRTYKLALVIPAHNEEQVIEQTILSAIKAGQNPRDIYVASDNSSDKTVKLATAILGPSQVKNFDRGGKAITVKKALYYFELSANYEWIHVSDADGKFDPNYFKTLKTKLDPQYAAATGYISSLPGGAVSDFRTYEYAWSMEILRRIQQPLNLITIVPGPTSCFRADVVDKLDFFAGTLTEDFDITMQIHRQRLGKIQYIDDAIVYTQDPKNTKDLYSQISRWYRGSFQVAKVHKLGFRGRIHDTYFAYQFLQVISITFWYGVFVPILVYWRGGIDVIASMFLIEVMLMFVTVTASAALVKKMYILRSFPIIFLYRWLNFIAYVKSFIEVIILDRFKTNSTSNVWSVASRRY